MLHPYGWAWGRLRSCSCAWFFRGGHFCKKCTSVTAFSAFSTCPLAPCSFSVSALGHEPRGSMAQGQRSSAQFAFVSLLPSRTPVRRSTHRGGPGHPAAYAPLVLDMCERTTVAVPWGCTALRSQPLGYWVAKAGGPSGHPVDAAQCPLGFVLCIYMFASLCFFFVMV